MPNGKNIQLPEGATLKEKPAEGIVLPEGATLKKKAGLEPLPTGAEPSGLEPLSLQRKYKIAPAVPQEGALFDFGKPGMLGTPTMGAPPKLPEKTIYTIPLDKPEKLDVDEEDFEFWEYMGRRFTSGSEKLLASIFRTPETIYDISVNAFNLLLEGQDYLAGLVGVELKSAKLATSKQLGEMLNISNVPAERLESYALFRDEIDKKYQKPITESISKGNYKDAAISIAGSISESLPFTLAILVPSAAGVKIAPLVAGVTTTMAAQRKQELLEREDLTETQKNANAIIYGLAESIDVLFGAGTVGRAIRGVVKKEGREAAQKFSMDIVDNIVRTSPYLQPFVESLQEGITRYIQNVADITILGEKKSTMDGVSDAMIVGFTMGLGGGGIIQGIKTVKKIAEAAPIEPTGIPKAPRVELEKSDYEFIEKAATDEDYYNTLTGEFALMVEEGTLTKEEGEQLKKTLDETIELINKFPPGFDVEKKNKAYSLIKEKQELELENEKLDEVFQEKNNERITTINEELKALQPEVTKEVKEEPVKKEVPEVKPEKPVTEVAERPEVAKPKPEVEITPELRKYTTPTEEKYGYIQEEGKEKRDLTKEEFEAEQAKVEPPVKEPPTPEAVKPTEIPPIERATTYPEYTTKDKKYTVSTTSKEYTTKDGKKKIRFALEILNIETGKIVRPTSKGAKKAIEEYKERILPIMQRGKEAEMPEGIPPAEVNKRIVEKSENPAEVAKAWKEEAELPRETVEDAIYEYLPKITSETFARYDDPNNITGSIRLKYFSKEGRPLDQAAEIIRQGNPAAERMEESELIEMITAFIKEHPGGKEQYEPRTETQLALEERFYDLTGFDITPEYADKIIDYKPKPEPTEVREEISEELKRQEEKRFKEKLKNITDRRAQHFDNIAQHLGVKAAIIGEKRPDVIIELQGLAKTYAEELGLRGDQLLKKVKNEITKRFKEFSTKFINENKNEILGEFAEPIIEKEELAELPFKEFAEKARIAEEIKKVEEAPVYVDENVSFVTDLGVEAKRLFQKYLTAKGLIPKKVFDRMLKMEGETKAIIEEIRFTAKEFKQGLKKAYGTKRGKIDVSETELAKIDQALKREIFISEIPEPIRHSIKKMRNQVDALSQRMIDEGLVEGKLVAKLQENLGMYLTRTYRIHDFPKWRETVPPHIKNKAFAYIRAKHPADTEAEIRGRIEAILDTPDSPISIVSGGKIGAKDLSILKKRKEIAPEIRALLGEYTDPLLNYARSITKMANLIEKSKFLEDVKKEGLNDFLFEKPTETHFRKIAAEGGKTMTPLNGLYTTPDIAEAFEKMGKEQELPSYLKYYMAVNGIVKYSKTILSLQTNIRNLISNTGFAIINGHWRAGKMAIAIQTTIKDLATTNNKDFRERIKKYMRLNVIHQSARAGELRDIIKDAQDNNADFEKIRDSYLKKIAKKGLKLTTDIYQAEDDVWKIYAFENELSRYKKAYPEMVQEELEIKVAEIIRNTYPTYSLVPEVIKKLRRFPLVGTFVSFPAEVVRTTYNTIELTGRELKNPETRSIGIERLTGILIASTIVSGAVGAGDWIYGVMTEEKDDLRRFMPPWSKHSMILSVSAVNNGIYEYIDIGYSDPHNYLKNPIIALIKGDDLMQSGIEAAKEFFEPFLSEELLTQRILDVTRNKKKNGAPVYNPTEPTGDKMAKVFSHFAEVLEPGTLTSFRRVWKGIHGTTSEHIGKYDPVKELIAIFTGQRVSKVDVPRSFGFKTYAFRKKLTDAKKIYNSVYFKDVPKEEKEEAYQKANEISKGLFDEILKDYDAAIRLGVKEETLQKLLKRSQISKDMKNQFKDGIYVQFKRHDEKKEEPKGKLGYTID